MRLAVAATLLAAVPVAAYRQLALPRPIVRLPALPPRPARIPPLRLLSSPEGQRSGSGSSSGSGVSDGVSDGSSSTSSRSGSSSTSSRSGSTRPDELRRTDPEGDASAVEGIGAWARTNILQGVDPSVETYTVMTVYFVQGVLGLAALARTFLFKDQFGLGPAESAALLGVTSLPWVIKPLYGFLSDGLPLFGYRRKSYLILAGLVGSASWLSLATLVQTPAQAVLASTLASLGVAVCDVVVDSLVVERARDEASAGSGALQSLCWSCQSVGALTSAYFSGALLEAMSPQQVFGITALFPLLVVLMSTQLVEAPRAEGDVGFGTLVRSQGELLWGAVSQRSVYLPTLFLCLWQATPSSERYFDLSTQTTHFSHMSRTPLFPTSQHVIL